MPKPVGHGNIPAVKAGQRALLHQHGEGFNRLDGFGGIDVAGGHGLLFVGQAAAEAPDEGADIPAAERWLVPAPDLLAVGVGSGELAHGLYPFVHGGGNLHARSLQHGGVIEQDLAVGVQGQGVVAATDVGGAQRAVQQGAATSEKSGIS